MWFDGNGKPQAGPMGLRVFKDQLDKDSIRKFCHGESFRCEVPLTQALEEEFDAAIQAGEQGRPVIFFTHGSFMHYPTEKSDYERTARFASFQKEFHKENPYQPNEKEMETGLVSAALEDGVLRYGLHKETPTSAEPGKSDCVYLEFVQNTTG